MVSHTQSQSEEISSPLNFHQFLSRAHAQGVNLTEQSVLTLLLSSTQKLLDVRSQDLGILVSAVKMSKMAKKEQVFTYKH